MDPPGAQPKDLLQRTALNLDGSDLIFGFGGNDGDCADYRGTVVAAPLDGSRPRFWQVPIALPATSGGAVWAPSGPAVDGAGNMYATTGNPDPPEGHGVETYDYSDSVVKLDPTEDFVADPLTEQGPHSAGSSRRTGKKRATTTSTCPPPGRSYCPGACCFRRVRMASDI